MKEEFKLDEIEGIADKLMKELSVGIKEKATILALYGDLGAGKTTITKEVAKILGIKEKVISPTFVIMKKYKTKNKTFKNLIHIDAYRFDSEQEILMLGWRELIGDKDNLIILEWPEKVEKVLPKGIYSVKLEHKNETTRSIKFCYNK